MKRNYDYYYNNNIPDYIIEIASAIKNEKDIIIILNKDIGDEIDDVDYIIDYLKLVMDNKIKEIYVPLNVINFIYRYYSTEFNIFLEYNEIKEKYRISCIIKK